VQANVCRAGFEERSDQGCSVAKILTPTAKRKALQIMLIWAAAGFLDTDLSEYRPHESLGDVPPFAYMQRNTNDGISTFNPSI